MTTAVLVGQYLAELTELGRSEHTLRGYRADLRGLVDACAGSGGLPDARAVTAFLASLRDAAPATRARRCSAARGFLRWAGERGFVPADLATLLAESPATPAVAGNPWVPDGAAVRAVLTAIPRQADRDQLLFGLLARLGLRPGEALALRIEDFDERGESLTVTGWGGARRRVLVDDPEILMRLVNWVRTTGRAEGPLFRAAGRSCPLRYQSVAERWARYQAAAGASVRLGDLRRFHAHTLLAGGVPEWVVRERLGQRTGPLPGTGPADGRDADDVIRAWRATAGSAGATAGPAGDRAPERGRSRRRAAGR